uniref:Uncharacterized protein n=1 Tax=Phaseolus vulgaris TaxID=3885 RepID=V7B8N9_PHAVU|nr:hypothetical protein PHAVU_008G147200g [Phaseolus vulgaris]ESW12846.1 hypothetical protein PHAVU_008G147200g [Phaseolus vulgaris]
MIKLRLMRFSRISSKLGNGNKATPPREKDCRGTAEIQWELRPGGMLVQKRESNISAGEGFITITVSTVSQSHEISIEATSTFGTDEAPAQMGSCFHGKQNQWNFGSCWLEESFYLFCSMICLLPENQKIS